MIWQRFPRNLRALRYVISQGVQVKIQCQVQIVLIVICSLFQEIFTAEEFINKFGSHWNCSTNDMEKIPPQFTGLQICDIARCAIEDVGKNSVIYHIAHDICVYLGVIGIA